MKQRCHESKLVISFFTAFNYTIHNNIIKFIYNNKNKKKIYKEIKKNSRHVIVGQEILYIFAHAYSFVYTDVLLYSNILLNKKKNRNFFLNKNLALRMRKCYLLLSYNIFKHIHVHGS